MAETNDKLDLVVQIAASYLRRNSIGVDQLGTVMKNITTAVIEADAQLGEGGHSHMEPLAAPMEPEAPPTPAVPIEESVQRDYLICLEDGQHARTMKRHLASAHQMTPQQYRTRWNLPRDYPMSAPAYSESRSALAVARGLGRKPGAAAAAAAAEQDTQPAAAAAASRPKRAAAKKPASKSNKTKKA